MLNAGMRSSKRINEIGAEIILGRATTHILIPSSRNPGL
jgi:hypothetical protein